MVGDRVIFLLQRQSAISFDDHNGGQLRLHSANDAAVNHWKKLQ